MVRCKYFASYMRPGDEQAAEDHTDKINEWLSENDDVDFLSIKTHIEDTMIITELWYEYGADLEDIGEGLKIEVMS